MNLILSDDTDSSTTRVQFWMKHFNMEAVRLNGNDAFFINAITINNNKEELQPAEIYLTAENNGDRVEVPLQKVNKYWYRRGAFHLSFHEIVDNKLIEPGTTNRLNKAVSIEYGEVIKFLNFYLNTKQNINSFNDNYVNKLNVLCMAQTEGLFVPPTLIASNKKALADFAAMHKAIITKAIWNGDEYKIGEYAYNLGNTALFDFEKLDIEIPDVFPLTLFQAYIPKKYELRIFYLHEKLYASCIFSQRDPKTRIDFREYNRENPNRVVPYTVPKVIQSKIINLMKRLGMNSGSIDMVYGQDNNYYFLEVNPIGQFSQVSYPCNYYLEREIALFFRKNQS